MLKIQIQSLNSARARSSSALLYLILALIWKKKSIREKRKKKLRKLENEAEKKNESKADTQNGKTTCPIRRRCHHYTENCQIAPSPSPVLIRRPAPPGRRTREAAGQANPSASRSPSPKSKSPRDPRNPTLQRRHPTAPPPPSRSRNPGDPRLVPSRGIPTRNGLPRARWPRRPGFSFLSFLPRRFLSRVFFVGLGFGLISLGRARTEFFKSLFLIQGRLAMVLEREV